MGAGRSGYEGGSGVNGGAATRVAGLLLCAMGGLGALPANGESLWYTFHPDFDRGVLYVELDWETGQRKQSALRVSEHIGMIRNVPGMLRDISFDGARVRRDGAIWILAHRPEATIRCTYVVDPRKQAFDDWRYIHAPITTADFFHGLGNAFLLVPNSGPGVPDELEVVVRWQLPAGYKGVCSWGAGRTVGARIKVTDLRHSVYLAGQLKQKTIEEDGRTVTVAVVDRFGFTLDEFAEMTAAIIRCECDFMGERAFPDFVVTAIPVGDELKPGDARLAGSGLYNSFALYVAPGSELNDAVEHLFAHELFHYWNGRVLQAQQPERLVYWFVEGFTDYYALRILYESGPWDAARYAKWVNRHIREYYFNPAINASNAEIDADYWNKRSTVGEVAYQRGLLLGLRWHKLAREKGVSEGIDRLFKALVNRGRSGGFQVSNQVIRKAGKELLGPWFAAEFDRYVKQAATIELPADALAPRLVGKMTEIHEYELGFDQQRSLKEQKVCGLVSGSAATEAGLREGDRLVGWNIQGDPDVLVQLQVRHGKETQVVSYYPRGKQRAAVQFKPVE